MFCGKPIIAWSIDAALKSGCFDHVIVSTDDEEIAGVAVSCGGEVPFIRPAEIADDFTGTLAVINHALTWLCDHGKRPVYACALYATAPFVTPGTLVEAFELLRSQPEKQYCFGLTEFPFPIQRAVSLSEDNKIEMFQPECFDMRSQDLPKTYHDAGQFYWGRAQAFLDGVGMYTEHSIPFLLPSYLVQDIDSADDWKKAEAIFKGLQGQ